MTETFAIIPANMRSPWVVGLLGVILLAVIVGMIVVGAAFVVSLRGGSNARFEVSSAGLQLHGDLYGRLIPPSMLELDSARAVDLNRDRELQPAARTWGTALPGYRAGWFALRNGKRALLYITDPARVAYIPTRDNYVILLSVADPAALIASLHRNLGQAAH